MPLLTTNPPGLQYTFTQGDTVSLAFIATSDTGIPVNLTGATLSTQILGPNGVGPVTFPNSEHTLGNQTTNPGSFTLNLQPSDTANCNIGQNKEVLTEAVISGAVTYYRGESLLSVYVAVPTQ